MNINDRIIIRFKESEETINLEETFKVQISSGGVALNYDEETGKIQLLDKKNNVLSEIDLPTERVIKTIRYDEETNELIFEFDYAQEIRVPIGDLFNLEDYFNKVQILSLLEEKANKSEIPTKLSQLSNDKGYLTSVPSEYAKKNELFDKDYNKLINKPNIPSKLSDLDIDMELGVNEEEVLEIVENNSNQVSDEYTLATSQDVDKTSDNQLPTSKAVQKLIDESTPKIDLPTKLSDFENDKLFVNEQEVVEIVEEKIDESSTATQNAINSINDKITQLQELINNNEIDIEQKNTLVNNSIVEINKDIEGIKQILTSDDVDYDTLQELVNALKNNVSSISDIFTELSKKALNTDLVSHKINTNNPHNVTKDQVGLSNVDNTSDINKPISNAVQEALNNKANKDEIPTKLSELEIDMELGLDEEEVLDIIENNSEQVNNEYTLATSENFNETSDTQIPTSKAINDKYAKKSELFSKDYNDLTDKPTIPTKVSELENDSSFVTENSLNEFPRMFQASSNITLFEAWNPEMYDEDYVKTLILQLKNILGDSVRKKGYAQLEAYIDFPDSNGKKYSTGLIQKDEDCFYGMLHNRAEVYFYHYDDSFQVQLLVFSEDRATSFMMNITLYNDGSFSRKFEDNITGDILTLEEVESMELLDSIRIYNFLVLYQEV